MSRVPFLPLMRGLGELAVVSDLPPVVVDLFRLVTRLGDPWLLLGTLAVLYVVADRLALDRRRVACVLAAAFLALGVTLALKAAFALPRPPGAAEAGFGFPSGHALGATVVWGAGAVFLDVGRRRRRLALAGLVVPAVAVSRVVIGVHYLVDVVAGVAVGAVVVGLVVGLARRPLPPGPAPHAAPDAGPAPHDGVSRAAVSRVLVLAAGAGLVALLVRTSPDTLLTAGAAVGGWVGWRLAAPAVGTHAPPLRPRGTVVAAVGLPVVLGGLLVVDIATRTAAAPPPLTVGVAGACIALLLALPRVAARLIGPR
jgi:membrane-associated phospholipid phosphatase